MLLFSACSALQPGLGRGAVLSGAVQSVRMQVIPQRSDASEVVVAGGSTANVLFGKLQRASQLPNTRLNPAPIAAVDNSGALSSLLWSSFAMSNVPSSDWMEPSRLTTTAALSGGLLFIDQTTTEDKPKFGLPNPFAKKPAASAPGAIDLSVLEAAGARGAKHVFLLVEADAVGECVGAVEKLTGCPPTTLIAPCDGVALASTKGWVQKPVQDHEGVLAGSISVQSGYEVKVDEDGGVTTRIIPAR